MKRLKNKIAVITGASSGIGADISELFASEGVMLLLIIYHQKKELK